MNTLLIYILQRLSMVHNGSLITICLSTVGLFICGPLAQEMGKDITLKVAKKLAIVLLISTTMYYITPSDTHIAQIIKGVYP
jgi:hypothetical protein